MEENDARMIDRHLKLEPDADLTFREQPECHNVVCQGRFGKTIDQQWMMREFTSVSFRRGKFPSATYWHRSPPGSTHQVSHSGKVMMMGMYSTSHCALAYQEGMRMEFIRRGRDDYPLYPIQTENLVFSFHLPYRIRIRELDHEDSLGFTSVPDLFPGAIYRMLKPAVAMLIFESGSIMVLGVRDHTDLRLAIEAIRPVLDEHAYYAEDDGGGEATAADGGRKRRRKNVGSAEMKEQQEKRRADEKRKREQEAAERKLAKMALKAIKYAPVKNRAEFEALLNEEIARLKAPKKRARATAAGFVAVKNPVAELPLEDMPDMSVS